MNIDCMGRKTCHTHGIVPETLTYTLCLPLPGVGQGLPKHCPYGALSEQSVLMGILLPAVTLQ